MTAAPEHPPGGQGVDVTGRIDALMRDLRSSPVGLSTREAQRRLVQWGPNELAEQRRRHWPSEIGRQLTHPLALLLWVAAALAWAVSIVPVAIAVVVVIVVNAVFAFIQEAQAERAVEALRAYLPPRAAVLRDGSRHEVPASELVPGDVLLIEEGDRVSADARLLAGSVEVDMSMLTGESVPVARTAGAHDPDVPLLEAPDVVFSGTACTGGDGHAVVVATGMRTEIGRIAALSQRVESEQSPLERQVRRVAWLIALIAVVMAVVFIPLATLAAGLPFSDAVVFAVGLLVGNVPEGLLPVITLSLAVGVRELARRGAIVKRLSAVETLGSTDVICTDKTGTLTENRMRAVAAWSMAGEVHVGPGGATSQQPVVTGLAPPWLAERLGAVLAACSNASLDPPDSPVGDPTEIALLEVARALGSDVDEATRLAGRRREFHFDPTLKVMTTIDERAGGLWIHTKGAPEAVAACCTTVLGPDGVARPLTAALRASLAATVDAYADDGLRVLAAASRPIPSPGVVPSGRGDAERDLCLVGLVTLFDPPRPEVADAVARCRSAGVRVVIMTGDHPLTACAIARRIGIVTAEPVVVTGETLARMDEAALDRLLREPGEIVFARVSPEAKLRVADALRAGGHVVAMTGDGVNDAPALRRADIGVAMGRGGTDVAREASTMILTDDDFATIVMAIEGGRRTYDNVRKFLFYIFAHLTPELVPFLVFALAGGAIPLPLPILLLLAIDVGTETLPALALGREQAEPGIMARRPRPRGERIVNGSLLARAWLFVGVIAAGLEMGAFFYVLARGGWSPGAPVGAGAPLHGVYREAVTATFAAMVACQIGTAFAARTERASLRSLGVTSNRLLLWGIAFEVALAAAIVYLPALNDLFGTAPLSVDVLVLMAPFPLIVWGADEVWRGIRRRQR